MDPLAVSDSRCSATAGRVTNLQRAAPFSELSAQSRRDSANNPIRYVNLDHPTQTRESSEDTPRAPQSNQMLELLALLAPGRNACVQREARSLCDVCRPLPRLGRHGLQREHLLALTRSGGLIVHGATRAHDHRRLEPCTLAAGTTALAREQAPGPHLGPAAVVRQAAILRQNAIRPSSNVALPARPRQKTTIESAILKTATESDSYTARQTRL